MFLVLVLVLDILLDFLRKDLINKQEMMALYYNFKFILLFILGVNGIIEVINDINEKII